MGQSPVSGPTPNKGFEAAGLQRLGLAIKNLEQLVPLLGSSSPAGADVLKALSMLSKHVPAGSVTPAAEKTNIDRMAMQNSQNNQQMAALKQSQGAPGAAMPPKAA